jgi:hypothetical protein
MNKVLMVLVGGLLMGALAAQAKLPAPKPMSDADKAAQAQKDAAAKAKDADDLGKAQDRVVANYKKNHGGGGQASMGKAKK